MSLSRLQALHVELQTQTQIVAQAQSYLDAAERHLKQIEDNIAAEKSSNEDQTLSQGPQRG